MDAFKRFPQKPDNLKYEKAGAMIRSFVMSSSALSKQSYSWRQIFAGEDTQLREKGQLQLVRNTSEAAGNGESALREGRSYFGSLAAMAV